MVRQLTSTLKGSLTILAAVSMSSLSVALEAIADKVVVCDEDTRVVNAIELEVAVVVGLADVIIFDIAE